MKTDKKRNTKNNENLATEEPAPLAPKDAAKQAADAQPATAADATNGHLQQHVDRIRQLEATINTDDVAGRYLIGLEVAGIHAEDPKHGVKRAAKLLGRLSEKSLYEYQYVTETWNAAKFEEIRRDIGARGNVLCWSDYVGLSYINDAAERERVRLQALQQNKSVKMLRRKAPKPPEIEDEQEDESLTSAAPLPAALCTVLNDLPPVMSVLKTAMALLERPDREEDTTELGQLRTAVADQLNAFQAVSAEAVPMLLAQPAVTLAQDAAEVPASQKQADDAEVVPTSGAVVRGTEQEPADDAESHPEVEMVAAE